MDGRTEGWIDGWVGVYGISMGGWVWNFYGWVGVGLLWVGGYMTSMGGWVWDLDG